MPVLQLDASLYTGEPMINGVVVTRDEFERYWDNVFRNDPIMQQIEQQRAGDSRTRNRLRRHEVFSETNPLVIQRALELGFRPPNNEWGVSTDGAYHRGWWSRHGEQVLWGGVGAIATFGVGSAIAAGGSGAAASGGTPALTGVGASGSLPPVLAPGAVPTLTGVGASGSLPPVLAGQSSASAFSWGSIFSDPFTWLAIGGQAFDIFGQIRAGNAAQEAAEWNARVAELQAQDAIQRGNEEAQRFRMALRQMIGTVRAGFSGQNVDVGVGSPVDVVADAAFLGEIDINQIHVNAAREAWGFEVQAENFRRSGAAAASATRWGVAESLVNTGLSLATARYGYGG